VSAGGTANAGTADVKHQKCFHLVTTVGQALDSADCVSFVVASLTTVSYASKVWTLKWVKTINAI